MSSKTPITKDPRFAKVHNDPRFVRPKKKDNKVKIDKRFASMMTSNDFSSAPRVDKYGRRLKQDTAEKDLKRFYQLESDDEEGEEKTLEELEKELAEDEDNLQLEKSDEEKSEESEDASSEDEVALRKGYDPMRGRGEISSSESDESDESEEEKEDEEDELDEHDAIRDVAEGEETKRLALVNMDWDKIKAVDILKVLNGFKSDMSIIKSVTIYPSEFGKERITQEDTMGPPKEIFKSEAALDKNSDDDDDDEVTEASLIKNQLEEGDGQDFDQEALRKYQLDRLKYYYAVIECDTAQTAKHIYQNCDNTEYESSANFFDLRYIPDEMTFDDEPKEVATVAPEDYTPTKYTTDALQHTKVSLTWDEDDIDRYQVTRREFTKDDLKQLDFDMYLASSSDEDEEEDIDAVREKYRKLLGSSTDAFDDKTNNDDDEGDMEITFTPGLSEAAGAAVKGKNQPEEKEEETSIETYVRKQREKRKAKKEAKKGKDSIVDNGEDTDEEMENDPFFKEALDEMENEGLVSKAKDKKKAKKRASKEEREEKARERAELELLMDDDGNEGFNMKEVLKREKMEKKKKGNKKGKNNLPEDDFEINVTDPRFAAIQDSHHFAIDPTNPQFKKTKSMKKLMDARQSKMKIDKADNDNWKKEKKPEKKKDSLSQLVASVKRKGALDKSKSGKRQKN
ncbi:hypothetical protein K501DRAFT_325646 [Backusella circina FSU 941]|nr:hypothetical protein K501DRAFT_325646 [Backusella circina FSU 941]